MTTNPLTPEQLDALIESAPTEEMYRALFELRKLRTSLPVQTLQGEWQPISTAPKDGATILLYGMMPEGPRVTAGHWLTEEECTRQVDECGGDCRCPIFEFEEPAFPWSHDAYWESADGGFLKEFPPTLWMPYPAPPSSPQTESPVPQMESNSQ